MNRVSDRTDRGWADRLELETGYWWLVLQVEELVIAFYRGYWNPAGVYHTGDCYDPEALWACIRDTQHQSRLWAIQNGVRPVPPVLEQQLPDALRTAVG
ncbi:hypothetical protein [Nonomuraea gerenzanensis]|uniref:hypothetical protein n=1 Tax=Nonomuraea gerenzanensis TaxID=93944 RepID=UPI001CD9E6DF|nr:hypothetical protein [Nonomuraea gerenzanensis]UBU16697.1 hypothetical protein LCN96_17260 [Nonomuraea gerenzanensis]